MNIRFYLTMVGIISLSLSLSSCNNNPDEDFTDLLFEKDVYSVIVDQEIYIPLVSGNGKYSVIVDNENVITAEYSELEDAIYIQGTKEGESGVRVIDVLSKQEKKLTINVMKGNAYLTLKVLSAPINVSSDDSDLANLITQQIIENGQFAVDNLITLFSDTDRMYIFKDEENLKKGEYISKGTYKILEGDFTGIEFITDQASIKYSLDVPSINNIKIFLASPIKSTPYPMRVFLRNNLTDFYKNQYPDISVASVTYQTLCRSPYNIEVPVELL